MGSRPTPETFPELPTCIVWVRGGLALLLLLLKPREGATSVLLGLNVITFVPILWCQLYLLADTQQYQNLNFAGVPNALALYILVWIYLYSSTHANVLEDLLEGRTTIEKTVMTSAADETISPPPEPVVDTIMATADEF
jgi:hypothetical protein